MPLASVDPLHTEYHSMPFVLKLTGASLCHSVALPRVNNMQCSANCSSYILLHFDVFNLVYVPFLAAGACLS